jgi:hypothetical protein
MRNQNRNCQLVAQDRIGWEVLTEYLNNLVLYTYLKIKTYNEKIARIGPV